jgi:hypothetical protein
VLCQGMTAHRTCLLARPKDLASSLGPHRPHCALGQALDMHRLSFSGRLHNRSILLQGKFHLQRHGSVLSSSFAG